MNRVLSFFFVLCLMLGFGIASAQTTYTKVTSADQLVIGGKYIIVAEDATNGAFALGGQKTNNRAANTITISGNTVSVTEATQNEASKTKPAIGETENKKEQSKIEFFLDGLRYVANSRVICNY
ncbi:MAG: hypothetical protein II037_03960, partial [Bacteroidales bacterium]|nr:hypothetical protein [Bacteroidales bacterium]